jgi:ActR/RegA family two-component response regulator
METSLKLLVIDDEDLMLSSFETVLGERGHAIATARSGREGVEMARRGEFDVVVTDIKMPDMSGIQVLEAIREFSDDIGVVLITGYASLETAIDAVRLGADAYLYKPFENLERDVLGVIERIAAKYRLKRENNRLTTALNEANEHLKRTNVEFRRTLAHLNTQQQVASMLSGATDIETVAALADQALVSGFETPAYALLLAQGHGRFEMLRGSGLGVPPDGPMTVHSSSGALGAALEQRWPTQLSLGPDGGREPWMPEAAAALVVPCIAAGAVVGALVAFDPDAAHLFAPETVSLYSGLAAQIAAPLALAKLGAAGVTP